MRHLLSALKRYRVVALSVPIAVAILLLAIFGRRSPTATPLRTDLIEAVFASGHTMYSDEYVIATNTEGFILKSYVKEGDAVEVGDTLFRLSSDVQSSQLDNARAQYRDAKHKASPSSPQVLSLQTQIAQAKAQVATDKLNYDRYAALLETHAVSRRDFEKTQLQYEASISNLKVLETSLDDLMSSLRLNLQQAESQLRIQQEYYGDSFIRSAKSGTLLNIYKEQGELAKRGEYLGKIGSGKIIARLLIAEEDIGHVRVGQLTRIALNTNREKPIDAKISRIFPAFDAQEQSFILEATFVAEGHHIMPNTQLQANIIVDHRENVLVIPADFLGARNTVTLADNSEVTVETGLASGGWVEILSGIDETNVLKKVR